jgi:MULE transposase domain
LGSWYALILAYEIANSIRLTGVPVAWMLTSSGTEATIRFFLNFVKSLSPDVAPAIIMSDRDKAQMNAVNNVYPDSKLLLCWWHVLRAIRMHFRTEAFPEVWDRIREWVKTPDQTKFDSLWEWIQTDASVPQSLVDYLRINWMTVVPLWSGTMR